MFNNLNSSHLPHLVNIYFSRIKVFALLLAMLSGLQVRAQSPVNNYAADNQTISHGEVLFQQNCASCHNFKQKGIGPNLAGITAEIPQEWLLKFISNAQNVITSGDLHAKALYEEYKVAMPAINLPTVEIKAILSYVNTHPKQIFLKGDAEGLGIALSDPIPTKISKSGYTLFLEEVTTAPATAAKIPLARINQMRVLPGKKERVFLDDLRGLLYEMKGKELHVVMDIPKEIPAFIDAPGLATGFGSYAFHPDFYKNGLFYTTHTEKAKSAIADFAYADSIKVALQWVLTAWKISNPKAATFSGSHLEVMRIDMPVQIHGVQEIIFNPLAKRGSADYGLLYIGVGDGGSAEGGYAFLCNTNTQIRSSVLRIDPLGRNSKNGRYGIPPANPFAQDDDPNTLGEVFARGFRNPNRISWSPDGKMLISDIGLNNIEELNIGIGGADYGWPSREGTFLLNYKGEMNKVYALPEKEAEAKYTYPVVQFDHDEGNAFSGGFVYTGKISPLKNKYIFGDIVSGRVFFVENDALKLGKQATIRELDLNFNGKAATFRTITGNSKPDLRFGVGAKNEFYLYTKTDGKIWRVSDSSDE